MASVSWPSREDAEVVEVEFVKLDGATRSAWLLVDSGFTGNSSFVLPDTSLDVMRAAYQPAQAVGALQGRQRRAWVKCRIPALAFERTLVAIVADTSPLSLPADVEGLAGLSFLRQFSGWGAEQIGGRWEFGLTK